MQEAQYDFLHGQTDRSDFFSPAMQQLCGIMTVSYTHLLSYDLKIRYICPDCREQEENNAEGGTQ